MIALYTTFLALLISTWTDLKTREVPDWISYGTIGAGMGLGLIASLFEASWTPLLGASAGLVAGIIVGFAMYYAGQWGGGDAKLIMGLGALIGLDFIGGDYSFGVFLLNTVLAGAAYGLIWMMVMIAQRQRAVKKEMGVWLGQHSKWRYVSYALAAIFLLLFFTIGNLQFRILALLLAALSIAMTYLWALTKVVEKVCMVKEVSVSRLTEGDWIVNDVVVKGKVITGPKELGVTREQIAKLKKLKVRRVTIKEGIPFVPSFLAAYIALLLWGNWLVGVVFF